MKTIDEQIEKLTKRKLYHLRRAEDITKMINILNLLK